MTDDTQRPYDDDDDLNQDRPDAVDNPAPLVDRPDDDLDAPFGGISDDAPEDFEEAFALASTDDTDDDAAVQGGSDHEYGGPVVEDGGSDDEFAYGDAPDTTNTSPAYDDQPAESFLDAVPPVEGAYTPVAEDAGYDAPGVTEMLGNVVDDAAATVEDFARDAADAFGDATEAARDFASDAADAARDAFANRSDTTGGYDFGTGLTGDTTPSYDAAVAYDEASDPAAERSTRYEGRLSGGAFPTSGLTDDERQAVEQARQSFDALPYVPVDAPMPVFDAQDARPPARLTRQEDAPLGGSVFRGGATRDDDDAGTLYAPSPSADKPKNTPNRLVRSSRHGQVAGVCWGLGRYFNVDVTLVRILFVVATLGGGPGLLLYIVLWIAMPNADEM